LGQQFLWLLLILLILWDRLILFLLSIPLSLWDRQFRLLRLSL